MSLFDYSTTAASNTTISSIDIAEGCAPAGVNNAIRQAMADSLGANLVVATSGTDTYTATLAPAPSAYVSGMVVHLRFGNANTSTTPTINLNSLGAKTITSRSGGALVASDLSGDCQLSYDGTNFRFMGTSGAVTTTGTQTLTNKTLTSPTLTTPAIGSAGATFAGSSSGTTTLAASAAASGTLTLPAATDTLVGKATTDTLTNKTLTSPTLTTPTLGVATATSINKVAITTPASGSTLTIADGKTLTASNTLTLAGTDGTTMTFPSVSASIGYLNVPSNSQSAAYTAVLADAGCSIDHPSTDANARTFTIPANGSVAYPVGTVLSFSNMTSNVVTIAINTDTMYLAGTGTTGSRSLAQYGVATARKLTSTTWLISGTGLT